MFYGADYSVKPDNDKVIAFTDKKMSFPHLMRESEIDTPVKPDNDKKNTTVIPAQRHGNP